MLLEPQQPPPVQVHEAPSPHLHLSPQGQSPALRDVEVFVCFTVPQVQESPHEHDDPQLQSAQTLHPPPLDMVI